PDRSLGRPMRPLSRGSGPSHYSFSPVVSYLINCRLSAWHLPPLVTRAFGAHHRASHRPAASSQRHGRACSAHAPNNGPSRRLKSNKAFWQSGEEGSTFLRRRALATITRPEASTQ